MIAFGTAMADPEAYRRYARPGIQRAAEEGAEVLAFAAVGAIGRGLNLILEAAGRQPDLEALVLVAQEAELRTDDLRSAVMAALADPDVAAVGPLGATGVRSIAWWDGDVRAAHDVRQAYTEHGGGELRAFSWAGEHRGPGPVDTLEGSVLVLSPWAVREVRFDEELVLGHGFDLDLCLQLRELGKRVEVVDLPVTLHGPLDLVDSTDLWVEAHIDVARKWGHRLGAPGEDDEAAWRTRARRAEAEKEGARTLAYSAQSVMDAALRPLRAELDALEATPSWRVTRPLRAAKTRLRARRGSPGA